MPSVPYLFGPIHRLTIFLVEFKEDEDPAMEFVAEVNHGVPLTMENLIGIRAILREGREALAERLHAFLGRGWFLMVDSPPENGIQLGEDSTYLFRYRKMKLLDDLTGEEDLIIGTEYYEEIRALVEGQDEG